MAAPDILELELLAAENFVRSNLSTSTSLVLTNLSESNLVYKVNDITVSNTGATSADVTVRFKRSSTSFNLANTTPVPINSSLTILNKDITIFLEEGDAIEAFASSNDILSISITYEIIGETTNRIITSSLAVHLDADNPSSYDNRENYVSYSNYNAATWTLIPVVGTGSLTTGISDPDGTNKAVRITCNNDGQIVFRVSIPSFTPNGTDQYTMSFYVRSISGTGTLVADLRDNATVAIDYTSSLVTNEWVRVSITGIPTASAITWVDLISNMNTNRVLDFYGVQVERRSVATRLVETTGSAITFSTPTAWNDLGSSGTNFTLNNPTYYSLAINPFAISFNRTMPPTAEAGGYAEATGAGDMTAFNYLHNNHSTEVWFKVDDRDPTLYTANEYASAIVVYPGFHSGWIYTAGVYQYIIWGETIGTVYNVTNTNFADTSEGVWTQLVAVRNDFDLYLYKNGVLQITARIDAGFLGTPSGNTLRIAMAFPSVNDFSWHADINVSILRMYKRALTADEVLQNYNAQKSRFGLS